MDPVADGVYGEGLTDLPEVAAAPEHGAGFLAFTGVVGEQWIDVIAPRHIAVDRSEVAADKQAKQQAPGCPPGSQCCTPVAVPSVPVSAR